MFKYINNMYKKMILSPIVIVTYNRINHLKQTINALKNNTLAKDSDLFIYIDGPKKGHEKIIKKVYDYAITIDGFRSVKVKLWEVNSYPENINKAFDEIINRFNKIILLEDDIVTAPGFLTFMNEALEFYKDDDRIITISGYKYPIKYKEIAEDVFITNYFSGWGMGTWKNKFCKEMIDTYSKNNFVKTKDDYKKARLKSYNNKLLDHQKYIDAFDSRVTYYEYYNNKYTLYPSKSLVKNIGFDGSGLHVSKSRNFYQEELSVRDRKFNFVKNINIDLDYQNEIDKYFTGNYIDKLISILIEYNLFIPLQKIYRKII